MFNKVVLVGNLTRDIEMRYSNSGYAIGVTAIAVTRKFNDQSGEKREETCFIDITFFGRTAEVANQYLRKGSKILVEGRLRQDTWQDKNTGQNRSKHVVVVETMEMLDTRQNQGQGNGNYGNSGYGNQNYGNSGYGNSQNYGGNENFQGGYQPRQNMPLNAGYSNNQSGFKKPVQNFDDYQEKLPEIDVDGDKYEPKQSKNYDTDEGDEDIPF